MSGEEYIALAGRLVASIALGSPEARKVASLLDDLRTERIKADYRMDDSRFQEPRTAMMCVEMAEDAKRCLERCRSDADAIQQGIQQWRRAVCGPAGRGPKARTRPAARSGSGIRTTPATS